MKINTDFKKVEEDKSSSPPFATARVIGGVLTKGVEQILPSKEKLKRLMQRKKIRLYLGIDPTSPQLHLGHAIPLRKLREFQNLGHEVILLFGTFTAQIGDPSERDEKRKPLTPAQIKRNMATYERQASKILDFSKIKIKYNADWLAKLKLGDILKLASHFTTSQLLEREMFQRRLKKGREVWVSEFLYPLLQGYDSVAMNVDLEIGSTDQTFNMLVGRKLQKIYNKKEKFVLTTPMLLGLDGRKMSKTYQNTVNLLDKSKEMYGKLMALHDDLIIQYFELCTDLPLVKIKKMERDLREKKINPRDLKTRLAKEIVTIYHGEKAALISEKEFERVFKEKGLPVKIPKIKIREKSLNILDLLVKTKMVPSKSEAKRLVLQKGVKIDGEVLGDWKEFIEIKKDQVLQIGKRKFVRLI